MKPASAAPAAAALWGGTADGAAPPDPQRPLGWHAPDEAVDERSLSRLKWRCRRGLLENDLFIERFFRRHEDRITASMAHGLAALMSLADNDLLDLLLARKDPEGETNTPQVREVLALMRVPSRMPGLLPSAAQPLPSN